MARKSASNVKSIEQLIKEEDLSGDIDLTRPEELLPPPQIQPESGTLVKLDDVVEVMHTLLGKVNYYKLVCDYFAMPNGTIEMGGITADKKNFNREMALLVLRAATK